MDFHLLKQLAPHQPSYRVGGKPDEGMSSLRRQEDGTRVLDIMVPFVSWAVFRPRFDLDGKWSDTRTRNALSLFL